MNSVKNQIDIKLGKLKIKHKTIKTPCKLIEISDEKLIAVIDTSSDVNLIPKSECEKMQNRIINSSAEDTKFLTKN